MVRAYVAAPYADAHRVAQFHARLRALRVIPLSTWAEEADGPEELDNQCIAEVRLIAQRNDHAICNSDLVVVLARDAAGGEMFAEARLALLVGVPVVWVGARRSLSAYRPGVLRVVDEESALTVISLCVQLRRSMPMAVFLRTVGERAS